MYLWIDDIRVAPDGWHWAKSYSEAIEALASGEVEVISLDYDLDLAGWKPKKDQKAYQPIEIDDYDGKSGLDIVLWMIHTDTWPSIKVAIHSANIAGSKKMKDLINLHGPYHKVQDFRDTLHGTWGVVFSAD